MYALDFILYWKPENMALEPKGPGLTWGGHKEIPWMIGVTVFKTSLSPIFSTVVFHCSLLYPVVSNPMRLMLVKVIATNVPVSGLARLLEGNIRSYLER